MATVSVVLLPQKQLKDGTHKLRIAISHKSVTSYIVTSIKVDDIKEFRNGQVVRRTDATQLNIKLRNLLNLYTERLQKIEHIDNYNVKQVKELIKSSSNISGADTLQAVSLEYCTQLRREKRDSYANLLEYATKCFTSYIGADYPLSGITPTIIASFRQWLLSNTKQSPAMVDTTLARIRTIINKAIKSHKVVYSVSPFSEITLSSGKAKECDLSVASLQKIIAYQPTSYKRKIGRDMFLLSFYLGGMNLCDILDVNFNLECVNYTRKKTRNATHGENIVKFKISDKALAVAKPYIQRNGKIDLRYNFQSYQTLISHVGEAIRLVAKEIKLQEDKVVFYSARKSFAQFAYDLGIPDSVTDYIIGHSPSNRGVIKYYSKTRQRQADIAMQRIFDYVESPDKYADYIEMRADIMLMKTL